MSYDESYESRGGQHGPYEGGGYGREEYPGYPGYQEYPEEDGSGPGYAGQGYAGQYPEQHSELDPEQYQQSYPESERHEYPVPQYQDAQWAQSGLGWERQAWDEARLGASPLQEQGYYEGYEQYEGYGLPHEQPYEQSDQSYEPTGTGRGFEHGFETETGPETEPDTEPEPGLGQEYPQSIPRQRGEGRIPPEPDVAARPAAADAASRTGSAAHTLGRGAFGAAGIGVVAAVAALASSGALLVVVALVQAGVAYGWQHATTLRENRRADRRAVVLTALIGWVATAVVFRLPAADASVGLPAVFGVGFLLLAADQTLRRSDFGEGERAAGLAITVTGAVFALLPAGFVVAERLDSGLTAACAFAAAFGVLCCALLGRNAVRGILAALILGAGVGAVAAQSLQAQGGLDAGALGGAVAALAAAAAVGASDRVAAEGDARGSTRVVTQALPVALAAMGALFAAAVYR